MKRNIIALQRPERFTESYSISKSKLEAAASLAIDTVEKAGRENGTKFPLTRGGFRYFYEDKNTGWLTGMYTGLFWLCYELTGNPWFKNQAEDLAATFQKRFDEKIGMDDHDVGFNFIPSCVAQYNLTGNEKAKKLALDACEYFYEKSYSKEGKFIIRTWRSWDKGPGCRTMMDSMMNAPLLFWAAKETGNEEYFKAARDHVKTTEELLIRADGSSYHHYQFDPETAAPVRGLTLQGRNDESCWSRGHAWGIYGFPVAYSFTGEEYILDVHRDISYFMLNHLPDDFVPAWDYDYTYVNAIKDASAGVISTCGFFEMANILPDTSPDKKIFRNAGMRILNATIDHCSGPNGIDDKDGLIYHVTGYASNPNAEKRTIDQIAIYGDYFYLEALTRLLKPDYKSYWLG